MKMINLKKMKRLTKELQESYKMLKSVIFVKKSLKKKYLKDKKCRKIKFHCHYTEEYRRAAHKMCYLKLKVPKKISIVFHNGSNHY